MTDLIPLEVKRFRASIFSVMVSLFVVAVGLTTLAIIIKDGFSNIRWLILLKVLVFLTAPLSFLCALRLHWKYTYGFSSDGVYAYSICGVRRHIKWEDVSKVRKFSIVNLSWLRIYSSIDGNITWLALSQARPVEFRAEIQKFAPSNNPLLEYLN